MYSISQNGKEHIIQFAPKNWIISDRSSTYFNEPSDYYIDAIEDSEVSIFTENFLENLQQNHSDTWGNHTRLIHRHTRNLQKRINMLLGATAKERYLDFIKTYPNLFQRVPQWMVASYLGITLESLSRVRKEITKN